MMVTLAAFFSGAIMLGFGTIGFFFFRFWRKTRDGLFGVFAASFWILAIERIALLLTDPLHELRPMVYLIRLSAFMLLLVAFWAKNRPRKTS